MTFDSMWMAFDLLITPPCHRTGHFFLCMFVSIFTSLLYCNLSADIAAALLECEFIRAKDCVYSPQNL